MFIPHYQILLILIFTIVYLHNFIQYVALHVILINFYFVVPHIYFNVIVKIDDIFIELFVHP
jgi:hypothetical protein